MVHPVNELRKAREDGLKKAQDPDLAFVTRAELRAVLGEALAPFRAALEISDLDAAIDELDGLADSGDPTSRPEPATDEESLEPAGSTKEALSGSDKEAHPAESDPEGIELAGKIHERKSRAKRKPEGQDPLGLVPDAEED